MTRRDLSALAAPLALAGALVIATPIVSHAANCDHSQKVGNPHCDETDETPPPFSAATPELDSIVLFGAGALALAGVIVVQRRRQPRE